THSFVQRHVHPIGLRIYRFARRPCSSWPRRQWRHVVAQPAVLEAARAPLDDFQRHLGERAPAMPPTHTASSLRIVQNEPANQPPKRATRQLRGSLPRTFPHHATTASRTTSSTMAIPIRQPSRTQL